MNFENHPGAIMCCIYAIMCNGVIMWERGEFKGKGKLAKLDKCGRNFCRSGKVR